MTGEEWDGIRWFDDAFSVLASQPHGYDRKLRLLTCACFRSNLSRFPCPAAGAVIDESERYADDPGRYHVLRDAVARLRVAGWDDPLRLVVVAAVTYSASYRDAVSRYRSSIQELINFLTARRGPFASRHAEVEWRWVEQFALLTLLRDIFGNPFRPVAFDPRWRTPTAIGVARRMYDAREFSAMPILADALQDAGCEDETILGHCRDAGQLHVRG
jgi:hypothetical protein